MLATNLWHKWLMLFGVLLLAFATYFSLSKFERFYPEVDQLLTDPGFLKGAEHWFEEGGGRISLSDNFLTITNTGEATHTVYQSIAIDQIGYHRVSFEASTTKITKGAGRFAGAGVFLRYHKGEGIIKSGSVFLIPVNPEPLKSYQFDTHIRKGVQGVDLVFQLSLASGEFSVGNIKLSRLQETNSYHLLKSVVVLVWLLVALVLLSVAARNLRFLQLAVVAMLCGVALVGALVPETILLSVIQKISAMLPQMNSRGTGSEQALAVGSSKATNSRAIFSNIGHFMVFTLLGYFAGLNFRKIGLVFAASSVAVFAVITEVLQLLVSRRTASLDDLIIDAQGVIVGLFAGCVCILIYENWSRDKNRLLNR